MAEHPYLKFDAPSSIAKGSSLAAILDHRAIQGITDAFNQVLSAPHAWDVEAIAKDGEGLPLMKRAEQIATAIEAGLPASMRERVELVVKALGPRLISTEDFGLKTFFYLPYSSLIKRAVDEAFEEGLQACAELTQRSTAEFAIRPYWNADPEATLRQVDSWVADPNPHVRRLVSEGARSRLPWGVGLPMIKQNPEMVLPLLEKLKDDPVRYVTRSVANHLGDIAKDHPDTMISVCERWLEESQSLSSMQCKERRWTIRHACRYLDKKGHHEAQKLRLKAK